VEAKCGRKINYLLYGSVIVGVLLMVACVVKKILKKPVKVSQAGAELTKQSPFPTDFEKPKKSYSKVAKSTPKQFDDSVQEGEVYPGSESKSITIGHGKAVFQ